MSCYCDPLMTVKFQQFAFIANILAEYLITFRSDSTLVPFLSDTIEKQYCRLCKMVIKIEVLDLVITTLRLLKIDVNDKENRLETDRMSLGTATSNPLKEVPISSEKKVKFKNECHMMIVKILTNLKERLPLKYSVVHNASSLSRVNMVREREESILKFDALVDGLHTRKINCKISQPM